MKMSKKRVGLIITLLIVSLAGLLILQGTLLRNSIELREQTFDASISQVLANVSEALETNQAVQVIIDMATDTVSGDSVKIFAQIDSRRTVDTTNDGKIIVTHNTNQNVWNTDLDSTNPHAISIFDSEFRAGNDSAHYRGVFMGQFDNAGKQIGDSCPVPGDSSQTQFLERVMNRIWLGSNYPLEERIDSVLLDSVLADAMTEAGLDLQYQYGIALDGTDSILYATTDDEQALRNSMYSGRLFQFDFLSPRAELKLIIPDRRLFIWSQATPILISIVLLMAIIIFCFVYSIRIIFEQRRGAALMTEFVNNMTHEFKTPISTISLAAEAIGKPAISGGNTKVADYSRVIQDENNRMRRQTEKILQMAALEEGRLKLKWEPVDLHRTINEAVSHFGLQIEQRNGSITADLKAESHTLPGDKIHLSGIVYNLIDNAIKYSPEGIDIRISSLNADRGIYISVSDNGIGIKEDDLKIVFRKYFRVSTGNIHDIKGFGLGLSYVKLMTEAHGGKVTLKSRPGEGTRAELFFPLKGAESEQ